MTKTKKAEAEAMSFEDKFEKTILRFSASLADLREFSELVESLIKKHKLKELEAALARYEGLGDVLCQLNPNLKSDISSIPKAHIKKTIAPNIVLKFEIKDNDSGTRTFRVGGSQEDVKELKKSLSPIFKTENSVKHLQRSSLISLISIIESFLSQLLHIFFEKHPAALNAKEKQFTFEELSAFSNLDDARSYLISWKIENLLRGSYEDWIGYFRTQVKLDLSFAAKHQIHLVENFQRRNLFVHNDGIVNKIYLTKVDKSLTNPEILNKKRVVSKNYLFAAIDRFESCFLQLAFELWAKCDKNSDKRLSIIIKSSYEALQNKRWQVATELAEIVEKDKTASEINVLMARVNSWIARKKFDKTKALEEIKGFDVSAKDDVFKLAKHCLLEETEAALTLIKRLEQSEQLALKDLTEWPLFEDLRATPQMTALLEQIKSNTEVQESKVTSGEKKESDKKSGSDSIVEKPEVTVKPKSTRKRIPSNAEL